MALLNAMMVAMMFQTAIGNEYRDDGDDVSDSDVWF